MGTGKLSVPFQACRRSGSGERLFLPLRLDTVEYFLRFADGAHERYQVAYTASIEAEKSRGRWRYRGYVSRQISIYNRAGEQFEKLNLNRRLEPSKRDGQAAIVDWRDWHEYPIESASASPDDEFAAIYQLFTQAFAASIVADKRRVEMDFRQMYKGIEAISEID